MQTYKAHKGRKEFEKEKEDMKVWSGGAFYVVLGIKYLKLVPQIMVYLLGAFREQIICGPSNP